MAWKETHYSKHMHFRWEIKWRLEHFGALGIMGETAPLTMLWRYPSFLELTDTFQQSCTIVVPGLIHFNPSIWARKVFSFPLLSCQTGTHPQQPPKNTDFQPSVISDCCDYYTFLSLYLYLKKVIYSLKSIGFILQCILQELAPEILSEVQCLRNRWMSFYFIVNLAPENPKLRRNSLVSR